MSSTIEVYVVIYQDNVNKYKSISLDYDIPNNTLFLRNLVYAKSWGEGIAH